MTRTLRVARICSLHFCALHFSVLALIALRPVPAAAQAGAAPMQSTAATTTDTPARQAILARTIAVHLDQVPLRDALATLAAQARVRIIYSSARVPLDRVVSLVANTIALGDALQVVLRDTNLDVGVTATGWVTLDPQSDDPSGGTRRPQQATGAIAGRVTDAVTKSPLDQVAVRVEGSGLGVVTTSDGRYIVRIVAPGTYRVTARRVGYTPLTRTVSVAIDSVGTADFALAAAPTKLNEMVTTALGDQRRYEVGNDISTINADSIASTAPITSLTDLISARAPGVQVLETGGMTGSGEAIRIRGLSSLVLQNDPILIVDGVRQDNSAGGDIGGYFSQSYGGSSGTHPTPTRLNDIDFSDVESIDVLKGPSASTEYGTDAANGVIVITTKRGAAGSPQWKISAEQAASEIPERFPDGYYSWGHTTDGTHTPVDCRLVPVFGGPGSTAGTCVVDSVTKWNPLNHAATSVFGPGSRGKYDLSVSGGAEVVRYFVSGGLSNETGIVHMPAVFRTLADTAGLGLPNTALAPNREQQRSVRATTMVNLGRTADLTAIGRYSSTYQQTPNAAYLSWGVFTSPALRDAAHNWGYEFLGFRSNFTPLSELTAIGSQNTDRVTGGVTANWRPLRWFVGHATVGLDHGSQQNKELDYPLTNAVYQYFSPFLGLADGTTDIYSVDLRGVGMASLGQNMRAVTSAGLQMVDTRTLGQSAAATGISSTNLTLNGAPSATVAQLAIRQATFGGYGEEELAVADRLFVTGALRLDAGSGFGGAYATVVYPKASVSWLALSETSTTLRLRGAFGESGVQPAPGAAATLYTPNIAYMDGGSTVTTYTSTWPGNQKLRPERSAEFEGGADVTAWGNRVSAAVTGYMKTTYDALVNVSLGGSACCYTYQENIGRVRNTGVEGSATIRLVENRVVTWDAGVNASINHNTLLSLAPGVATQRVFGELMSYRQVAGYPLYGIWAPRVLFADANHDGIIEASDVTLADSAIYGGPSLPTREASMSTHLGLLRGTLTVGGLVDYRGGYRLGNVQSIYASYVGRTREANDPTAPLWLQARGVENAMFNFNALDAEDASYVRVRELSVTYALPPSMIRRLRGRTASLTGAVRNLALWTRYTGTDPEVSNASGANIKLSPTSGGYMVNNDIRSDAGAVPLARYWVVRLNVGL